MKEPGNHTLELQNPGQSYKAQLENVLFFSDDPQIIASLNSGPEPFAPRPAKQTQPQPTAMDQKRPPANSSSGSSLEEEEVLPRRVIPRSNTIAFDSSARPSTLSTTNQSTLTVSTTPIGVNPRQYSAEDPENSYVFQRPPGGPQFHRAHTINMSGSSGRTASSNRFGTASPSAPFSSLPPSASLDVNPMDIDAALLRSSSSAQTYAQPRTIEEFDEDLEMAGRIAAAKGRYGVTNSNFVGVSGVVPGNGTLGGGGGLQRTNSTTQPPKSRTWGAK